MSNLVTLSKTFTQVDRKGNNESDLIITVGFDPEENTVEYLERVEAYDYKSRVITNITHIMFEQFHDQSNEIVDSIDWSEVYAEYRNNIIESKTEAA